ncbi:MAG TPA: DUF5985 family protein [Candidatus Baltobacteraceae bacterium]|nr:DUF5985 family protein [Candidatus Baltobacteraceae bacterium]
MIASIIYILCTITSGACMVLLIRGYVRTRTRLLFWSALCFAGLCLNNAVLFIDIVLLPQVDLSVWRLVPAILGLAAMCYGLIMEVE